MPCASPVCAPMFSGLMAIADAQTVLAKYKQRATAAASDYVTGAQTTTKDPTQLAIAAIPRMRAQIINAIDTGVVANGLRRAGKQGWLDGVINKGSQNYTTGVQNSDAKFLAAFGPLLQYEAQLQQQIDNMPNVTDADRKARMNAWFDGLIGKSFKA